MEPKTHSVFAAHAAQLRPLLNRLVFYGIETCRHLLDSREEVRRPDVAPRALRALTPSQLARLTPELSAAGYQRVGRTAGEERWQSSSGAVVMLESSAEPEGEDAETGILEYATLMTVGLNLESGHAIRISALPAQIALIWRLHRKSGQDFSASPWIEDLIELVVRRTTIGTDVAALPAEIRNVIAESAAEFSRSEAALWSIERALVDARAAAGCAALALERFHQLGTLANRPG